MQTLYYDLSFTLLKTVCSNIRSNAPEDEHNDTEICLTCLFHLVGLTRHFVLRMHGRTNINFVYVILHYSHSSYLLHLIKLTLNVCGSNERESLRRRASYGVLDDKIGEKDFNINFDIKKFTKIPL